MRNFICLLFLGLFIFACQEGTTNTEQDQESTTNPDLQTTPELSSSDSSTVDLPKLVMENYEEDGMPKSTLSVDMGGSKIKVTEAIRCEMIDRADYEKYFIPEEAFAACGGWWAGTGEYYYMFKSEEGDYYEIMKAAIGEEDKEFNGYPYLSIMKFVKKSR